MLRAVCVAGCAAVVMVLPGCGGSQSQSTTGDKGAIGAMDRIDRAELVPLRPGAAAYRSDPVASRRIAALDDTLRTRIIKALRNSAQSAQVQLVGDERLDQVVTDLARSLTGNELPHSDAIRFLLAHYGVVEPYPVFQLVRAHRNAPEAKIAEQLARGFAFPPNSRLVTLGIGIFRATTMMTIVLAMQPKHLDLAPVARKHPAKAEIELRGRLLGEFSTPTVYVTNPGGNVDQYRLELNDSAFRTRISCARGNGEYQLEVFGQDAAGPRVLANFPIYCGTAPPTSLALRGGVIPKPISASAAEVKLLAAINESRKTAGLQPLAIDTQLSAVARAHSADMMANNYFAHVSAKTGGPADRVKAAGIELPDRLLENIGKASSVTEIHSGLMRSPGHRAAILDPYVTRVGIGAATSTSEAKSFVLIATELFR